MFHRMLIASAFVALLSGTATAKWDEVQALQPGEPVLVQSGFVTDAGTFVSATADAVVVDIRTSQITVAKDKIDQVIVFRSRAARLKRALLVGGAAAGATAAVMFPLTARLAQPRFAAAGVMTATFGSSVGMTRYMSGRTTRIYRRDK